MLAFNLGIGWCLATLSDLFLFNFILNLSYLFIFYIYNQAIKE